MPKPSVEQQQSQVEQIKKTLADKGDNIEASELRDLKKKLRRAQRKHSRLTVEAERRAKLVEKKEEKAEEKKEEKKEAKAQQTPEDKPEEKKEEAAEEPSS